MSPSASPLDAVALVAVDGGASRCRLAAFDARGARTAEVVLDAHASLSLGEAEAWANLRAGLARLAATLERRIEGAPSEAAQGGARPSGWLPAVLALGLAGALREERRARLLDLIGADHARAVAAGRVSPARPRCHVVTDGHAQLVGATGGEPGICLAVGTGSVVHWRARDGRFGMAGGWGFPVGDEGSGAWLGLRLLQRHLWHRDGERSASPLMDALAARVGDAVSALQGWTTTARSSAFATLAPLIVDAAENGDALALSLLDEGAGHLARLIALAPRDLPIVLAGGLGEVYRPRLVARFAGRFVEARGDALDGLWRIAREPAALMPGAS